MTTLLFSHTVEYSQIFCNMINLDKIFPLSFISLISAVIVTEVIFA